MLEFSVNDKGQITCDFSALAPGVEVQLYQLDEAQEALNQARRDHASALARQSLEGNQFIRKVLQETLNHLHKQQLFLDQNTPYGEELLIDSNDWQRAKHDNPDAWAKGARDGMSMVLGPMLAYFRGLASEQYA